MSIVKTSGWVFAMQFGALLGYSCFGFVADKLSRKKAFIIFLLCAAVLVPLVRQPAQPHHALLDRTPGGLFRLGLFQRLRRVPDRALPHQPARSGRGPLVYNVGRGVSALAPVIIGTLAATFGIGTSLFITSKFYLCGVLALFFLPETKGQALKS